ncbi:MAG: hypothetical protein AABW54_04185 [Candidatus Micrarchaeota archaeon]
MGKWLPEWLARNYFKLEAATEKLWEARQTDVSESRIAFSFQEAKEILGASDAVTQKTLWELEIRGFLLKRREDAKLSSKRYFLTPFAELLDVLKIYLTFPHRGFEKLLLEKKLAMAPWGYMLTGGSAAYYYSRYQSPGKVLEIEVRPNDYGRWMAFLSDRRTVVNPDAPIETRRAKRYVRLSCFLNGAEDDFSDIDGLKVKRVEQLLVDFLYDDSLASATQAIALAASKYQPIDWKDAVTRAEKRQLLRPLGCVLEILNSEAKKRVVGIGVVKDIRSRQPIPAEVRVFPRKEAVEYEELNKKLLSGGRWLSKGDLEAITRSRDSLRYYEEIGRKWNMTILLPRAAVRKILDDLGVELRA